ncbi:MAG: xanthine dehydrogenase family protein molybdopterin-binding subunit, partial [Actinobacteria bacterium]|nr:xanthine dehydrogenase family protein molybdopterin-binding subunit [Actinomycetota bacterium]
MGMIGTRVVRTEDPDLVTGRGTFVDNLSLPGAAHVVYVRSTIAHARIDAIDIDEARAMPGVVGIFTATDLGADGIGPVPIDMPLLPADISRGALATDTVRFVGELVAAVVAETRAQAVDAAERVQVHYDPLPVVVDAEEAMTSSTLLFPERGSNVVVTLPAQREVDFSACDVIVERRILNRRIAPSPLEPRVAASRWEQPDENGVRRLTHWQACQGAHPIRNQLSAFYGLPAEQIRVITPDVGGGFGAKAFFYPEDLLLPWLARRT